MAKTATIARLVATLELESAEFRSEMERNRKQTSIFKKTTQQAGREVKAMGKRVDGLGKAMLNATGIAGAFSTVIGGISLTSLVGGTMTANRETRAYAAALKMSVEELSAWRYAVSETGIAADQIGDKLKDVSEKIADAYANGGGEGAEALKQLNLRAADLISLSPDKQIFEIAKALGSIKEHGVKLEIMEKLVSDGSLLLPILDNDAKRLRELTAEARTLNVAINEVDSQRIEEANRAWDRMKGVVQGAGNEITIGLVPYMQLLAEWFVENRKQSGDFGDGLQVMLADVVLSGARTMDALSKPAAYIKDIGNDIWQGYKKLPEWAQEVGIVGALLMGKKGIAALALLSVAAKDTQVTAEWFAAYTMDQISFGEWITSGNEEAAARLLELKGGVESVVGVAAASASVGESLFADKKEVGEFEASAIAALEKIQRKIKEYRDKSPAVVTVPTVKSGGAGLTDIETKRVQALELSLQREADAYARQNMTAEQLAKDSYDRRVEIINTAYADKLIPTEARKNQMLLAQEDAFQRQLTDIKSKAEDARNQQAFSNYKGMQKFADTFRTGDMRGMLQHGAAAIGAAGKQNRTLFKLQKALALGNAVATLPSAVMKSFDNGGGMPWGLIPAGLMAATGAVQIAAIKKSKFGGGGSTPSVSSGSVPSPTAISSLALRSPVPERDPTAAAAQTNIYINGDLVDYTDMVRKLRPYQIELEEDVT